MGTRADFYVGRGRDSEWVGSIAWDGYPDGIERAVLFADTETAFRYAVGAMLAGRDDATTPDMGWPWPWETSHTTDYAYSFEGDRVFASHFGHPWFDASGVEPDEPPSGDRPEFPDMTKVQKTTFGKRSGLIILGG